MTFGRELVVLLTKPSMFGKLEVHALEVVWRFEPITFYIGPSVNGEYQHWLQPVALAS